MCLVENEIHFVCNCPKYAAERNMFFQEINTNNLDFMQMTHENKFVYLMRNESKRLSKFVTNCWHIRKDNLYK